MVFFRDILSGVWYFLYLALCILLFFYVLGIVADRKRLEISKKLKEKKTYDIESGKEAQIAAMESKQILSAGVSEENQEVKKQEEPMVISTESMDNSKMTINQTIPQVVQTQPVINNSQIQQPNIQQPSVDLSTQTKAVEPLVLNSNE